MVETATISGRGRIWRDGRIAVEAVDYTLACQVTTTDSSQQPGTLPRPLSGHLQCSFPQWLLGTPIELELEDGRRWHCQLASSGGFLIDRGGVYRISAYST